MAQGLLSRSRIADLPVKRSPTFR